MSHYEGNFIKQRDDNNESVCIAKTSHESSQENLLAKIRLCKAGCGFNVLLVLSDASSTIALDLKSQALYGVLTADKRRHANILHCGSGSCRCRSRSIMAAELHVLVHTVNIVILNRRESLELPKRKVQIEAHVHS